MQDLSLHVLDIVENSIRAKATKVSIEIIEDVEKNQLRLRIGDNGMGMDEEMRKQVFNPFVTTRKTRKVGLGLALLYQNCLNAEGNVTISSCQGVGTSIDAIMQYNHVDRLPLGDMASSLVVLIGANPKLQIVYKHSYKDRNFMINTSEIEEVLEGIPINNPEILQWLREYIRKQIEALFEKE